MSVDWGRGSYEITAAELEPVAARVVAMAGVQAGESVLDLGTGTGNAAVAAARHGGRVTGLDGAPRLLEVARARASAEALEVEWVLGDLGSLPFPDASFDVVLSIFGIIFAPDPALATSELARVLRGGGRAMISAWLPRGPIDAMIGAMARAAAGGMSERPVGAGGLSEDSAPAGSSPAPAPAPAPRFPWHDEVRVGELAVTVGLEASFSDGELEISGASPEAYLTAMRSHPMALAMAPALAASGRAEEAETAALAILREANRDPAGFRVYNPYRVVRLQHASGPS